jgi:hypothetical protein
MERTKFPQQRVRVSKPDCPVCKHKLRDEIEAEILIGTSLEDIGEAYHIYWKAIQAHLKHMTNLLVVAVQATKDAVQSY